MIDTLPAVVLTFVATEVAKGAVGEIGKSLWSGVVSVFEKLRGRKPEPADITEAVASELLASNGQLDDLANAYFKDSPALRRAISRPEVLRGARILWIDDHPAWNSLERDTLQGFGCSVINVESTESALDCIKSESFDLIISDITRSTPTSGLDALPDLLKISRQSPVIFYVGHVIAGTPIGAFGITALPTELLHLILDALERRRS